MRTGYGTLFGRNTKGDRTVRKFWMGRRICGCRSVDYYLLVETLGPRLRQYGICVECGGERENIPGIAVSCDQVRLLLESMMNGVVTPVAARDVVEDWLAS